MAIALYIHVPYCLEKCPYCDFHSVAVDRKNIPQTEYVDRILEQLAHAVRSLSLKNDPLLSCFFGGGTPSLMSASFFEKVLSKLPNLFSVDSNMEITVETNPATADFGKFKEWIPLGINRISFGVQSYQSHLLKRLGRFHTADESLRSVTLAREAGFQNVNLDLIFGIEGETMRELKDDLQKAVSFEPTHISAYQLTVEEGTPLSSWVRSGKVVLPDEERLVAMQQWVSDFLGSRGYGRYEISNYAKPGLESKHNLQYWRYGDYLGIGSGGVSFVQGKRWRTTRKLKDYLNGDFSHQEEESISEKTAMGEFMMMGLRLSEGVSLADFEGRFGGSVETVWPGLIDRLSKKGWLQIEEKRVCLTPKGFLWANAVAREFF